MKISLLIFAHLLHLSGCFGQTKTTSNEEITQVNKEIDTIIEKNDPNSLDLSKHQLFIDTTRTYEYYDRTEKWNLFENSEATPIDYVNHLYKSQGFDEFDLKDFPKRWIRLRQYKNKFILYDRCDGTETSYGLTDSIFYVFGVHELQDVRKMKRIIKRSEDEIKLELEKYKNEPEERPLTAHIKKTGTKDVYKLRINFGDRVSTIFVTPIRSIRGFDVLINHCPINKVVEFDDKLDN